MPTSSKHLVSLYELEPVMEARRLWEENGDGNYMITWSDGGMDWTNDGPVYFDSLDDLVDEVRAAIGSATETHIPCTEFVG